MVDTMTNEIDKNFDFFQRNVARFAEENSGRYALIRDCSVVGFFDTIVGAEIEGMSRFADDIFSIQEVTSEPVDLGFFSHAVRHG